MARARIVSKEQKRARLVKQSSDYDYLKHRTQQKVNLSRADLSRMYPNATISELISMEGGKA